MKILFLFILVFLVSCSSVETIKKETKISSLIANADKYVGMHENNHRSSLKSLLGIDPTHTEWCAAFVNVILDSVDIPGSSEFHDHPLMARSFLNWGNEVESPQRGDIIIFPRDGSVWQGHVGFYINSFTSQGIEYYTILGGNQNDKVSYSYYRAKTAISIRRWSK